LVDVTRNGDGGVKKCDFYDVRSKEKLADLYVSDPDGQPKNSTDSKFK
jgi:hypothetical protein